MRVSIITFPGSNCDRDMAVAVADITGTTPAMIWHKDTDLQSPDLVILPGGFSFGDYLRCGAIAASAQIMEEVIEFAYRGGMVLGVCNGFQILIETGLLPGALIRNRSLKFICRDVKLTVHKTDKSMLAGLGTDSITLPIAHNQGQFFAGDDQLKKIQDNGQIAMTYTPFGDENDDYNPNGSARDIAAITSENGRILGMMPHPERRINNHHGKDGRDLLSTIIKASVS